jgi:hypothetical protein
MKCYRMLFDGIWGLSVRDNRVHSAAMDWLLRVGRVPRCGAVFSQASSHYGRGSARVKETVGEGICRKYCRHCSYH